MDNDFILKKKLVKIYRDCRLHVDYWGMGLLNERQGNDLVLKKLQTKEAFAVGRLGAVEMHCVSKWMQNKEYSEMELDQAMYAAGIFPNDTGTIDLFCSVYTEAMQNIDVLGVWEVTGEKRAIKKYCPKAELIPSRSIEPYYYNNPWSQMLKGKKLLVIHPFVESIQQQLQQREKIWPEKEVLPILGNVAFVKAVQSNAGSETVYTNWFEALEAMKKEIEKQDFEVAIIGAGAYGLPLAVHCKLLGKQAIQMSGATQILFGIKGKRWDEHPVISKFYNDAWIRPSNSETPPQTKKVEGGSYW